VLVTRSVRPITTALGSRGALLEDYADKPGHPRISGGLWL
jgi:hypothetical protein